MTNGIYSIRGVSGQVRIIKNGLDNRSSSSEPCQGDTNGQYHKGSGMVTLG